MNHPQRKQVISDWAGWGWGGSDELEESPWWILVMTPIRYLSTENTPEIQLYCPLLDYSFLNNSSDFWSGTKNLDQPKTYFGTRHKLQVLRCPHCGCLRIQKNLLEEGSHVVKFCTSFYSSCVSLILIVENSNFSSFSFL